MTVTIHDPVLAKLRKFRSEYDAGDLALLAALDGGRWKLVAGRITGIIGEPDPAPRVRLVTDAWLAFRMRLEPSKVEGVVQSVIAGYGILRQLITGLPVDVQYGGPAQEEETIQLHEPTIQHRMAIGDLFAGKRLAAVTARTYADAPLDAAAFNRLQRSVDTGSDYANLEALGDHLGLGDDVSPREGRSSFRCEVEIPILIGERTLTNSAFSITAICSRLVSVGELRVKTWVQPAGGHASVTLLPEGPQGQLVQYRGEIPVPETAEKVDVTVAYREEKLTTEVVRKPDEEWIKLKNTGSTGAERPTARVGPDTLGLDEARFTDFKKLGEGVHGDVHRAWDTKLSRPVAIKFIRDTGRAALGALQHARAMARVPHPNVVAVYEIADVADPDTGIVVPAVVMELVEGATLTEKLGQLLGRHEARAIGTGLLEAIGAYHARGTAHGDFHEDQVIIGGSLVKVLDPLYFDTALMASTATREGRQARDLRMLRDSLCQILYVSVELDVAMEFERRTVGVALGELRTAFVAAIDRAGASGHGEAAATEDQGATNFVQLASGVRVRLFYDRRHLSSDAEKIVRELIGKFGATGFHELADAGQVAKGLGISKAEFEDACHELQEYPPLAKVGAGPIPSRPDEVTGWLAPTSFVALQFGGESPFVYDGERDALVLAEFVAAQGDVDSREAATATGLPHERVVNAANVLEDVAGMGVERSGSGDHGWALRDLEGYVRRWLKGQRST